MAPLAGDSLLQEAERDVLESIPPLTGARPSPAQGRAEDDADSDDVILVLVLSQLLLICVMIIADFRE